MLYTILMNAIKMINNKKELKILHKLLSNLLLICYQSVTIKVPH